MSNSWKEFVDCNADFRYKGIPRISVGSALVRYHQHFTGRGDVPSWHNAHGMSLNKYFKSNTRKANRRITNVFFDGDYVFE